MRARALTLLVALALTGAQPTYASVQDDVSRAADPPTRTIVASRLPRGRDARVDRMQDGVVRSAAGRSVPVRTAADGEQRQLLGSSSKGWLVAVRKGYVSRVVAVRADRPPVEVRRTRTTTHGQGETSVGWLLSRDGEMLVRTTYDRGGSSSSVQTLGGKVLGGRWSGGFFTPFDADDGHVVTWSENTFSRLRVVDWVPRTSRTEIAKSATYVSLRDDLAFVRTTGRLYGPSPVSAPATPAWAQPFSPLAVSPDGETAIGLRISASGFDSPAVLDVRRMSDGALLDSIAYGARITQDDWSITAQHEQTAAWEDDETFVFQLTGRAGSVLVRCDLDRQCERASDVGGNISFPHETFMWW
ncbi:hypothetical protein GCM10023339_30540 [Alloalcanivorax gelatiniphagus]